MFHDIIKKYQYSSSFLRRNLVHVNLQILYHCNFKCRICEFWKEPYRDMPQMPPEAIKIVSDKLHKLGPQIVTIGGGEPFLHPELIDICRIISKKHFGVMITNGWFVTPENARAIFSAGLYEASVSLDYADSDKHDEMRGKSNAFKRAVSALKILNENRVYPYQRVHMITTVFDDNLSEIEPLIQLSRDIGITYLISYYSDKRGNLNTETDKKEVQEYLLKLHKQYKHFVALRGYLAGSTKKGSDNGTSRCHAGKNLFNIDSNGNVSLCIDRMDDTVGNILTDDICEIKKKLLDKYRTNTCDTCWTSCRGSIETLMYGKERFGNYMDYYRMSRDVRLGASF